MQWGEYTEEVYGQSSGGQPPTLDPSSSATKPARPSYAAILDAEGSVQGTHPLAGPHLQDSVSIYNNSMYERSSNRVYGENPTGQSCLPDTDAEFDSELYAGIFN